MQVLGIDPNNYSINELVAKSSLKHTRVKLCDCIIWLLCNFNSAYTIANKCINALK